MRKVVHLTSVHPRYDTRIFLKMCRSLVTAGYDVALIVAEGNGDEIKEGVAVYDVGKAKGRIDRMLNVTRRVLKKAKELDAGIYHIHDPELIPAGLWLKRNGKKVIFDSHEDVSAQTLSKHYIWPPLRRAIAGTYALFEKIACRRFDAIVAATPHIARHFMGHPNCTVVRNYPIPEEFVVDTVERSPDSRLFAYVGGVSRLRGAREMIEAVKLAECSINLIVAGDWEDETLLNECRRLVPAESLSILGNIGRADVRALLGRARAGLVLFKPSGNHIHSQPNKLFEYMSAGIPVVASNFPLWREIVEGNGCGICVNPLDIKAIADAMAWLVSNQAEARQMGENGRHAITNKFNWQREVPKLLTLYKEVCGEFKA